jgi:ParB-like chromosome segregation protein Spo0J
MSKHWRETVKVHPAADLFPMRSDEELDALAADIKKNGLQHKLVFWGPNHKIEPKDYQLLDGRNRIEAMVRAGIQVDLSLLSQMNCAKAIPDPYA